MYNVGEIKKYFNLPISHIKDKIELNEDVIDDLELIESYDNSKCIYEYLLNPNNKISKETMFLWSKYYTNNKSFINDSINLYKNYKVSTPIDNSEFLDLWLKIKNNNNFLINYQYIDVKYFEHLNNCAIFMMYLSVYNILSPVIALITPILILIIPFLIIKIRGLPVTFSEYKNEIMTIIKKNAIGFNLINFNNMTFEKKIYLFISIFFYFFQMYNNTLICYRFYSNQKFIRNLIEETKSYLTNSIDSMNNFLNFSEKLNTYSQFNESSYSK